MSLARTRCLSPDSNSVTRKGPGLASWVRGGPWDRREIGDRAQGACVQQHVTRCTRRVPVISQTRRGGHGRCRLPLRWHQQDPRPFPPPPHHPPCAPRGHKTAATATLTQRRARGEGEGSPYPSHFHREGEPGGAPGPLVARQGCPRSADWGESFQRVVYY